MAEDLALGADGSIYVASNTNDGAIVQRLTADGTRSPAFGQNGTVKGHALAQVDRIVDIVVHPNGTALAVGAVERLVGDVRPVLVPVTGTAAIGKATIIPVRDNAFGDPVVAVLPDGSAAVATSHWIARVDSRGALVPFRDGSEVAFLPQPENSRADAIVPGRDRVWLLGTRDGALTIARVDPRRL